MLHWSIILSLTVKKCMDKVVKSEIFEFVVNRSLLTKSQINCLLPKSNLLGTVSNLEIPDIRASKIGLGDMPNLMQAT